MELRIVFPNQRDVNGISRFVEDSQFGGSRRFGNSNIADLDLNLGFDDLPTRNFRSLGDGGSRLSRIVESAINRDNTISLDNLFTASESDSETFVDAGFGEPEETTANRPRRRRLNRTLRTLIALGAVAVFSILSDLF